MRVLVSALLALAVLVGAAPASAGGGGRAAGGWARLADAPFRRSPDGAALGLDRRIYVILRGNDFLRLDPRAGRWDALAVQGDGNHSGLVAIGDRLYAVGGAQDPHFFQSFNEVYSLRTGRWQDIARSRCAQIGAGAALGRDGRIYMGGAAPAGPGSCFEAYDPHTVRWTTLAYIPRPILSPGVAAGPDGRIYVIGGVVYDQQSNPAVTRDVQIYDPRANRWALGAPMPTARGGLAAVTAPDGAIYAVGGSTAPANLGDYRAARALPTVEVYDPRADRWRPGPPLGVARYLLAAVLGADGRIYAIGGLTTGVGVTRAVEALQLPGAGAP